MASESGTVADGSAEVGKPKPRATRKRRRWLVLLLLIGGLVWALPWIVGSTQLKQTLTYQVLPWLPPGATFESPSLGWTAPIHLSQVRILDRVVAEKMLIQGYHFPFPACGHIIRSAGGYDFVPALWDPVA